MDAGSSLQTTVAHSLRTAALPLSMTGTPLVGGDALGFAKVLLRAHKCVKQASCPIIYTTMHQQKQEPVYAAF